MNKKVIICIGVILTIIFAGFLIYLFGKSDKSKLNTKIEQQAYDLFGKYYCTVDHSFEIARDALTKWKCKLCGVSSINPDTNVPKMCEKCANLTGRCYKCGKLKK